MVPELLIIFRMGLMASVSPASARARAALMRTAGSSLATALPRTSAPASSPRRRRASPSQTWSTGSLPASPSLRAGTSSAEPRRPITHAEAAAISGRGEASDSRASSNALGSAARPSLRSATTCNGSSPVVARSTSMSRARSRSAFRSAAGAAVSGGVSSSSSSVSAVSSPPASSTPSSWVSTYTRATPPATTTAATSAPIRAPLPADAFRFAFRRRAGWTFGMSSLNSASGTASPAKALRNAATKAAVDSQRLSRVLAWERAST